MKRLLNIGVTVLIGIVILNLLGTLNIPFPAFLRDIFKTRVTSESVLEILKREHVVLLVTERVCTRIALAHEDYNNALGTRETMAYIDVDYLFGMDLEKLDEHSIYEKGDTLFVNLPEVEILESVPDLGSMEYLSKMTGLWKIYSELTNYNEVETIMNNLDEKIDEYAYEKDLLPDRSDVILNLQNSYDELFCNYHNVVILQ